MGSWASWAWSDPFWMTVSPSMMHCLMNLLTVSTKTQDSCSQTQLLADSLSKKQRFLFSKANFSWQSQQKAKILVLKRNFELTVSAKVKMLVLKRNFELTVSAKSTDSCSQTQLLADSLSKKQRFLFSKANFSWQSQQKAKKVGLRRNF